MDEPDLDVLLDDAWAAVSLLKRSQGIVISEIQANDQRRWQVILDGLSGLRTRLREERRAGLSPIARTEIERVRDALRQDAKAGWAKAEQPEADHVAALEYIAASCEANMDALTAVLGAESTKEGAGNG